jgi:hypothetical protein
VERVLHLRGCEYLGGCPAIGSRVLNKVELVFDSRGLCVLIAPQGLFTAAMPRPVLDVEWSEIDSVVATCTPRPVHVTVRRCCRVVVHVLIVRLDLPYQVEVVTAEWAMSVGVRESPARVVDVLRDVLVGRAGRPAVRVG